jgi:hypothetical protein
MHRYSKTVIIILYSITKSRYLHTLKDIYDCICALSLIKKINNDKSIVNINQHHKLKHAKYITGPKFIHS